jgi:ABC-type Fe3+ transport system permease subunit
MTGWLLLAVLFVSLLPIAGLVKPLLAHPWPVARAWREVVRTGGDTLLYAALAAGLAVLVAFALAWSAGGSPARRRWLVTAALALLALPPALPALWLIPWSGRFTLGLALALRGLPLAMLFALRAVGSMPASWTDAARVHRVPRATFLARVVLPWCARWAGPAAALAALLATAEIGTVLLLHPPGHGSLPLAIFTIMANAPEALVAMLCLLYVGLAATAAVAGQPLVRRL